VTTFMYEYTYRNELNECVRRTTTWMEVEMTTAEANQLGRDLQYDYEAKIGDLVGIKVIARTTIMIPVLPVLRPTK
jgi:hypothetical protein